jgi:hypothetical protein
MYSHKNIILNSIKIIGNKDTTIINDNENDFNYVMSSLTCDGGGYFKKGITIGMQDKMIPGLIIYDSENFYGFSEKNGLSLLSTHPEYNELNIPTSVFENKEIKNIIQPTNKDSKNFNNLVETKNENKNLNIDIEIKDTNNFYIIIPIIYSESEFIITFDITYIYDLNSIISNLSLVFINKSNKIVYFKIINDNCYYEDSFTNDININSITKINVEVINDNYFLFTKKIYKQ